MIPIMLAVRALLLAIVQQTSAGGSPAYQMNVYNLKCAAGTELSIQDCASQEVKNFVNSIKSKESGFLTSSSYGWGGSYGTSTSKPNGCFVHGAGTSVYYNRNSGSSGTSSSYRPICYLGYKLRVLDTKAQCASGKKLSKEQCYSVSNNVDFVGNSGLSTSFQWNSVHSNSKVNQGCWGLYEGNKLANLYWNTQNGKNTAYPNYRSLCLTDCKTGCNSATNTTCRKVDDSYICTCMDNFYGKVTSSSPTSTKNDCKPCHNNATSAYVGDENMCTCDQGFSGDGISCVDIDECKLGTHNCSAKALCSNTYGSYQCGCFANFLGDGFNCLSAYDLASYGLTVNCSNTEMVFEHIEFDTVTVNLVVNDGYNNTGCTLDVNNVDRVKTTRINYTTCGDKFISTKEDGEQVFIEATIKIASSGKVWNPIDQLVRLSCSYTRDINMATSLKGYNVTGDLKVVTTNITIDTPIVIYETENMDEAHVSEPPKNLGSGEPLFVAMERPNNPQLKMVVQDCWASVNNSTKRQTTDYMFLRSGCSIDRSFKVLVETNSKFGFQIELSLYAKIEGEVFLHCSLFVCKAGSTDKRCQLGCSSSRSRRDVHGEQSEDTPQSYPSTKRRAIRSVGQSDDVNQKGFATSGSILYKQRQTCELMKCSDLAACIETTHEAICRCPPGYVMDQRSNDCTANKIVQMENFHLNLTWMDKYSDQSSVEFQTLAHHFEKKMFSYYAVEKNITEIKGVGITEFTKGSVIAKVALSIAANATGTQVYSKLTSVNRDDPDAIYKAIGLIPETKIIMLKDRVF